MKDIKWIFFDIGYTLVNEDEIWQKRIEDTIKIAKEEGIKTSYVEIYDALLNAAQNYQSQAKTAAKTIGVSHFGDYCPEHEILYPDVTLVLQQLKSKYQLGVIANQCANLEERLAKLQIREYFDLIVSSHDVNLAKPDQKIFILALKQANCQAENAAMVGDRLDNDIVPAKALGMKTVRIKQGIGAIQKPLNHSSTPNFTINTIKELLTIF